MVWHLTLDQGVLGSNPSAPANVELTETTPGTPGVVLFAASPGYGFIVQAATHPVRPEAVRTASHTR